MENYSYAKDEALLFKCYVHTEESAEEKALLLLTDQNLVLLQNEEQNVYPLSTVKTFDGAPQLFIKQECASIYFNDKAVEFVFYEKSDRKKFCSLFLHRLTGKTGIERGADKIKGAWGALNRAIGEDNINALKSTIPAVIGNKFAAMQNKSEQQKLLSSENANTRQAFEKNEFDNNVDRLVQLKKLQDADIITEEEFNQKKKEIMRSK